MDVTVPMLQNVRLAVSFHSGSHCPPPSSRGALGVTFTPTVSPALAHLSTRQPTVGITLVQALDLFRLVLREGNVLDTQASSASNPELTIYQETEWPTGL